MPKSRPPALGASLRFLRFAHGWTEEELGRALNIKPVLISRYERGSKTLSRERLEQLLAVMGVPPESIEGALYTLGVGPAFEGPGSPRGPHSGGAPENPSGGRGGRPWNRGGHPFPAHGEHPPTAGQQDRDRAGELWQTLQALSPRRTAEWPWRLKGSIGTGLSPSGSAPRARGPRLIERTGRSSWRDWRLRIAELAPGKRGLVTRVSRAMSGPSWAMPGGFMAISRSRGGFSTVRSALGGRGGR